MAVQGYRIVFNLSDAQDRIEVLKNLNLNYFDLQRIRYIKNGDPDTPLDNKQLDQIDLITVSGLDVNVEKESGRIENEVRDYVDYTVDYFTSVLSQINVNVDLKGRYISPTYKFFKLNWDTDTTSVVDFSTSRRSAWSNFGLAEDQVQYNNVVEISAGQSIDLDSIELLGVVTPTRYESEIPTHTVNIEVNGTDYEFFAMKGIPFTFTGFFRNAQLDYIYNVLPGNLRPTIVVKTVLNDTELAYPQENSSSDISTISPQINNTFIAEREIQFYYPSDQMLAIDMPNLSIQDFPDISFNNLSELRIEASNLTTLPNFARWTPILEVLDLNQSILLSNSPDPDLGSITTELLERFPQTLSEVNLSQCYGGEVTGDFRVLGPDSSSEYFYQLTIVEIEGTTGKKLTSPLVDGVRNIPSFPSSIQQLYIGGNAFDAAVFFPGENPALSILDISNNEIDTVDISPLQSTLTQFYTGGTNQTHEPVDVSLFTQLRIFSQTEIEFVVTVLATTFFNGCSSLEYIACFQSTITGALPDFTTNTSLNTFLATETLWNDAIPGTFSIGPDTFGPDDGGCRPTLREFQLYSDNMSSPIADNAFRDCTELTNLIIFRMPIGGGMPSSITDCTKLEQLEMYELNLTGNIININLLTNLERFKVDSNSMSGTITDIELDFLELFNIAFNEFTGIGEINCPSLQTLRMQDNLFTNMPDFRNSPQLQEVNLSNNNISTYVSGLFSNLSSLYNINLSSNSLGTTEIDQILADLNTSYNNTFRTNVVVNLLGNAPPSTTPLNSSILTRLRNANWQIDVEV